MMMIKINLFLVLAFWVALSATVSTAQKHGPLPGQQRELEANIESTDCGAAEYYFGGGEEELLSLEEREALGLDAEARDLAYGYDNGRSWISGLDYGYGYSSGYSSIRGGKTFRGSNGFRNNNNLISVEVIDEINECVSHNHQIELELPFNDHFDATIAMQDSIILNSRHIKSIYFMNNYCGKEENDRCFNFCTKIVPAIIGKGKHLEYGSYECDIELEEANQLAQTLL